MHEGLCFTLADVIKLAYWALVHSGSSPFERCKRGFGETLRPLPSLPFGRPATRQPWPSVPALVFPMT
jgi:hypothetical protein